MRRSVRVLVTNDDGIRSPGLHALAGALVALGHDVVVAAPQTDSSGASAAIGALRADAGVDVAHERVDGVPADGFAVAGPPGLAVLAALHGAFGAVPDVVASGVNLGLNTGHSVLHSGTVGAALTAQTFGVSGLAMSIEVSSPFHFDTAAAYVEPALERLAALPRGSVLNVNVPAMPAASVRGMREARLDAFGSVRAATLDSEGTALQFEFHAAPGDTDPSSDRALVAQGWVTFTMICGVSEVTPDDMRSPVAVERHLTSVPAGAPR
jgi:5'-nucleotidase